MVSIMHIHASSAFGVVDGSVLAILSSGLVVRDSGIWRVRDSCGAAVLAAQPPMTTVFCYAEVYFSILLLALQPDFVQLRAKIQW